MLDNELLEKIRPFLESIEPMPAAFDQNYVKRLTGKHIKSGKNKCDLAEQIRNDIQEFKKKTDRQVVIWTGSTEIFLKPTAVHQSLAAFEKGMDDDDPGIAPSQLYAWAALKEGIRVHQRRAQPDGGHSRDERAVSQDERADLPEGTSRRGRR